MPIENTSIDLLEKIHSIVDIQYFEENIPDMKIDTILYAAVYQTLCEFDLEYKRISIALMNDEQIHRLNQTYRNIDRPTDVLSFANREGEPVASLSSLEFLGDIAISLETAQRQAVEYQQAYLREIAFLCIHGCLHLLGYDHIEPEEEQEMRELQRDIIKHLNI